jgi:hypothetical protein
MKGHAMCTDLFFHPFFQRDREGPEHVHVNCSPPKKWSARFVLKCPIYEVTIKTPESQDLLLSDRCAKL